MNLIDANAVSYIFKNKVFLRDTYYLAPDVFEEVEMTQMIHNQRLPKNISEIEHTGHFNESTYIDSYKYMLNSHGGNSFFNMTGFGDISILATVDMLLKEFEKQKTEMLFDPTEDIIIFTEDGGLTRKIQGMFSSQHVSVKRAEDIL